jgi:tRNA (cytidine/uridine-2'-O-)-methyltransferase
MLNVVLVEPEIPANTGNIGRTCVLTATRLHLVGPLGFELSDRALERAGLHYWESLDCTVYKNWTEFETCALAGDYSHVHLLTKAGKRLYSEATYEDGDWLIFGRESRGLDRELIEAHQDRTERIPMVTDDALCNADEWHESYRALNPGLRRDVCGNYVDERKGQISSLNLSNAVAICLYEGLRQLGSPQMQP